LITWNEDYPGVVGYVFGRPSGTLQPKKQIFADGVGASLQRACVTVGIGNALGEGIGVTFKGRRVSFLVEPSSGATYDANVFTDGVLGTSYSLNTAAITDYSSSSNTQQDIAVPHYVPVPHAAANESNNIHDFQLRTSVNTLAFTGVVVYWENTGANIEVAPGTNYVNKNQVTTTTAATLAVPAFGSSLGGKALIYQLTSGGYTFSNTGPSFITSVALGSSGTNLLNVTTGQGSRFVAGYGVIVNQGTSNYVGSITQVSTDTLTVSPTLSFGISNTIYVGWQANGATVPVSATLMERVASLDFSFINPGFRATNTIQQLFDPLGRWAVFQNGLVRNLSPTGAQPSVGLTTTSSAFLQVDGRFSAMEIETVGTGIFHATCSVNGHPAWGINTGTTAGSRWTLFTNAGPGWNSAVLAFGTSQALAASFGIQKINFYQIARDPGITFGQVAEIGVQQAAVERPVNATLVAPGTYQRIYADLAYAYPTGNGASFWINANAGNGQAPLYNGFSGAFMDFYYYGKNFALGGTLTGGSMILQLDGVNVGSTFNVWQTASTETFHRVQVQVKTNGPAVSFLDYRRTNEEIKSLVVNSVSATLMSMGSSLISTGLQAVLFSGDVGSGATFTLVRNFTNMISFGTDLTGVRSATEASSVRVNRDGLYGIAYTGFRFAGGAARSLQVTVNNASFITTGSTNVLGWVDTASSSTSNGIYIISFLPAGSILRTAIDTAVASSNSDFHYFQVTRLG
jgi:hypothetical protein